MSRFILAARTGRRVAVRRLVTMALAGGVLAACGQNSGSATAPTQSHKAGGSTLALSASDPTAHGVLKGLIIGARSDGSGFDPVGSVTIDVVHLATVAGGGPTDTAPNQAAHPDTVGSLVADADGQFTLTNIAAGTYALFFTPTASSPYLARDNWDFVSSGADSHVDTLELVRR
jgi:hypothetical protein